MAKKSQQERVQELTNQMNESIKAYQNDPKEEMELLRYLRQFRKYSVRNTSLIQNQYEGAVGVASYKQHQDKGYQVQKGEKAIRILAPRFQDVFKDENNEQKFVSRASKAEKIKIKNGEIETKEKLVGYLSVPVFDITQTNAPEEDYPKLYPNKPENFEFKGSEKDFEIFKKAVYEYANEINVKVNHGKTNNASKGYYVPADNNIMLRDDLNEQEETKVLLHELAHAKMHNKEKLKDKDQKSLSTNVKEYQAEMTAYIVSSTFRLDSKDYSERYLVNWTKKDVDNDTYIQSLQEVKEVSNSFIKNIANRYNALQKEKGEENINQNTHRENFKNEIKSLLADDETMAIGEPNEIIYKIDDINVYGGFEMGIRGVDHNILIDNDINWEDIIEYGTVVVPESQTYISNEPINGFEDLGYSNLPTNDNHIIKGSNQNVKEKELTKDEVAEEIGFLTDKKGHNHFTEMKDKILKATKLKTESKNNYQTHIVRLESKNNDIYTEEIITPELENKDIKRWEKGMTGEEWLSQNLLSELPKNDLNVTPKIYDNELMDNELDDIKEHVKDKEITQTR